MSTVYLYLSTYSYGLSSDIVFDFLDVDVSVSVSVATSSPDRDSGPDSGGITMLGIGRLKERTMLSRTRRHFSVVTSAKRP